MFLNNLVMREDIIKCPSYRPKNLPDLLQRHDSKYWTRKGNKEMLRLFHDAAENVPAYKDFLAKHGVNHKDIKTIKDFKKVPPMDKDNYLRAYPYEALTWNGNIKRPLTIHATSGSTGEPTYFERELSSDLRRAFVVDSFFERNKKTTEGPTLFIVAFGMGVWSAGMGIYTGAYLAVHTKQRPVSIITPGVNKTEVLKILRNIAPRFKQVIIAGYPPFVKDVIDEADTEGIPLKKFSLRFIFTGEAFTEEFRDYLSNRADVRNVLLDTMNTYGTSELGPMAVETPLSIMVRRLANKKIFKKLFGDIIKTPTLTQYIPDFINFECVDDELYFTGDNTIPLIRYKSGDHGGVLTFKEAEEVLAENGVDLKKKCKEAGIEEHVSELPMVYVYERRNLAATLYGVLIYPEFVKSAVLHPGFYDLLTGKFTIVQKYDKQQDQHLEINLELRKDINLTERQKNLIEQRIVNTLKKRSSEFRELCQNLGERVHPRLIFWPNEHAEFFTPGSKQQWVKKVKSNK